ncbi:MAG TPA: hypothetical protein ENK47_03960 [Euryarchaeota archaeon]|nr:hypothetical protein [Euryarchaeota archaeon]
MGRKIDEIGQRLGLSEDDVNDIRREDRKWKILFFFGGALIALLAFILGLLLRLLIGKDDGGSSSSSGGGYPYYGAAIGAVTSMRHRKPSRVALMLASAVAFLAGLSSPVFGQSIDYGVYRK